MSRPGADESSEVLEVAFQKELSFEERCWYFLRERARHVRRALYLLLAAGLLLALALWLRNICGKRTERRFAALRTPEDRLSFAEEHRSHPLAGLCFLEAADQAYGAKNYAPAVKHYERAQSALKGSIFGGRAALGKAMSLLLSGEAEEGRIALLSTATDMRYPRSVRGAAFYLSAILSLERGKPSKAKQSLAYLVGGDYGETWQEQAKELAKNYHIEL
ncbi:MAG: hypothetical protein LBD54_01155 [Puniceicoccales bacterium]|jgi:hypothetical protein|nr:hypothetical protein [Puniceicoccales bacterium]